MHPGHSLIIVTEGAVTAYDGDDPECKPHLYTKGMGFVDHAEHVHIIRNEGDVVAKATAVQLVAASAVRRIDVFRSRELPFLTRTDRVWTSLRGKLPIRYRERRAHDLRMSLPLDWLPAGNH
jgi:hypothetical protein